MKHPFTIRKKYINDGFEAVQAQSGDTEEVLSLLVESASWLRSQGSSQWSALLQGEDSHNTPAAIQKGDVFVFKKEAKIAGMVILMQKPSPWDVKLWGDQAHEEDQALYLHRLAIRRAYARTGLGKSILQWSISGIQFKNKSLVRLDCGADNATLNAFYAANEFAYAGLRHGYSLYEKSVEM